MSAINIGVPHLIAVIILQKITVTKVFRKFLVFYGIGKFDFFVYRNHFHEVTVYLTQYLPHV
jgi:hypothetical protein